MTIKHPPGFALVSPYLTLKNMAEMLNFYAQAFSFLPKECHKNAQGKIEHAEMYYAQQVLLFGPEDLIRKSPLTTGTPSAIYCYVYCQTLEPLIAQATVQGAQLLTTPIMQPWGDYVAQLQDPEGYIWSFAEYRQPCPHLLHTQ